MLLVMLLRSSEPNQTEPNPFISPSMNLRYRHHNYHRYCPLSHIIAFAGLSILTDTLFVVSSVKNTIDKTDLAIIMYHC